MPRIYKPLTEEQKEKIRATHKARGVGHWLLGLPSPFKGKHHTEENKQKSRDMNLGKKYSKETNAKKGLSSTSNPFYGEKHTLENIELMKSKKKGDNNPNWRGGVSPLNTQIRNSDEYKLWRKAIFARDGYMCIWCGKKGSQTRGILNADHIKPFASYPELRFAIDNGRTLCVPCHKTTKTYGNRKQT